MSDSSQLQRVAFLGNFPPRQCGIATFTQDLCEAVAQAAPSTDCFVGAVNDREERYEYPPRVHFELMEKELDSYHRAADFLNFSNADVLCLQHEFGIYGGAAGSHVLALLKELRMPVVTTLHTVLQEPDALQRKVMDKLVSRSDRLVVMANKGMGILKEVYGVPESKVDVIVHGIPDVPFIESDCYKSQFGVAGRRVLLTFGLIGPGKGIEYAIEALPEIIKQHPDVVYIILGATHPNLLAREGDQYRLSLKRLAVELGVKEHVIFYNHYVSLDDLKEFIGAADIYLTPYLSEAQITSGTLAYVFGAGKAVVSTPYWHAQELLADQRGVLVPFRNSEAISEGVCGLLADPDRMAQIRKNAYAMGREMIWPAVAKQYCQSFQRARVDRKLIPRTSFAGLTLNNRPYSLPPLRLDHLVRMTDGTGLFQHAIFNVPNYHEGYCVDDNARAFILCNLLDEIGEDSSGKILSKLTPVYLSFLAASFNYDCGRFRNFMSHGREWLEEFGSEDSHARALWAVGTGARRSRNEGYARLSAQLFKWGLPVVASFTSPRAWAFAVLGIHEVLQNKNVATEVHDMQALLAGKLLKLWKRYSSEEWPWFEEIVSYDNARLSQGLILAGEDLSDAALLEAGLKSLRWLVSIQKSPSGRFRPIGNQGFYPKEGERAEFDQQPLEAQATISACLDALRVTGDSSWLVEAKCAFEWFLGRNDLGLALYDFKTGACGDGLQADRINENQGAESSLAFLLSLAEMSSAGCSVPDLTDSVSIGG
ncbi:glycosyltransferase family 4 protein [Pontiellaceae bacterium B1224]|nr:glycosyltransferase family 4 protein [Pontiellaceae bacterium B1224]